MAGWVKGLMCLQEVEEGKIFLFLFLYEVINFTHILFCFIFFHSFFSFHLEGNLNDTRAQMSFNVMQQLSLRIRKMNTLDRFSMIVIKPSFA